MVFGCVLAMCAGIVDAAMFLLTGEFVTNHTGHTAKLGMRTEGVHDGDVSSVDFTRSVFVLLSFCGGAFLCGMLIDKNQVHFGGKAAYGLALMGESLLLFMSWYTLPDYKAVYLASIASGLQNAMCTSHFGAVVRTTHVTGTLTDIGSNLGRMVMICLRRRCARRRLNILETAELQVDGMKLSVLLPLFVSFLTGCIIGAYLEEHIRSEAMLIPAVVTGATGFLYGCCRRTLKSKFKRMEVKRLNQDLNEVHDALHRAQTSFRHWAVTRKHQHQQPGVEQDEGGESDYADVDDQVAHALEVVHEMESALEELQSQASNGMSPAARSRSTGRQGEDAEALSPKMDP